MGNQGVFLAEAKTEYALKSIVYTGKTSFPRDAGVGLSEQVVLDLMEGFEEKGHKVYMDSFYSSPSLFLKLKDKNIGDSGTVNGNRKGMPQELKPSALSLKKGTPQCSCERKMMIWLHVHGMILRGSHYLVQ